ncbi:MAG: PAS domain-containing protein [bacterium]|nr:PAS domain-containing protein [bacterium]
MATFYREKFKEIRKLRKFTIDEIAQKAEIHRVTLSVWERGVRAPSEKNIRALAHALGVSANKISDLLAEEVSDAEFSGMIKSWRYFSDISDDKLDEQQDFVVNYMKKQYAEFKQASVAFKALLSAMQSIFYVKDTDLKFIIINNSFRKHFSLKPGFIAAGKTDEDFFTEKEAKINSELDKQVIYSGKPIIKLKGYIPGSRRKKMGMISKLPIFDSDGKIAGLVNFFVDMTKEFKSDENRKILEAALTCSSDVVWLIRFTPKMEIIFISDSIETIYGYSKETFINDHSFWWDKCIHPDDKKKLAVYNPENMKLWADNFLKNYDSPMLTQYRIIDAEGKTKWIEESTFKKKYLDIECMCFIERDITERHTLTEKQKLISQQSNRNHDFMQMNDMLKTLVANTSDVAWIKTFNQHYLLIEGAVEDILSVTKDSLLNSPDILRNKIHPDDIDKLDNVYSDNTFPTTVEYRIRNNKKDYKYIRETIFKNDKYFYGIIKII